MPVLTHDPQTGFPGITTGGGPIRWEPETLSVGEARRRWCFEQAIALARYGSMSGPTIYEEAKKIEAYITVTDGSD